MKNSVSSLLSVVGVLLAAGTASAIPNGPSPNPWVAAADTPNSNAHTGIVVTDSSYAACVIQFQNAMASHAAAHGDTFTNIRNCHYLATGTGGGIHVLSEAAVALSEVMQELEDTHEIAQYERTRRQILRRYRARAARDARQLRREARAERADEAYERR